eukprot:TRINITY_DN7263_c0_g1_i1.p1 TRINITY_DN7263_c0_g1~~TRINITY_DN7263_c0_g1_i1.p1  ORF type:complete len:502 (+),score=75.69 TRINITY_DN7263_c0_g1_i1:316-1821(+)
MYRIETVFPSSADVTMTLASKYQLLQAPRRSSTFIVNSSDLFRAPNKTASELLIRWVKKGKLDQRHFIRAFSVMCKQRVPSDHKVYHVLGEGIMNEMWSLYNCSQLLNALAMQRAVDHPLVDHALCIIATKTGEIDLKCWSNIFHSCAVLQAPLSPELTNSFVAALEASMQSEDLSRIPDSFLNSAIQGVYHYGAVSPTLLPNLEKWVSLGKQSDKVRHQIAARLAVLGCTSVPLITKIVGGILDQRLTQYTSREVSKALLLLNNVATIHPSGRSFVDHALNKLCSPVVLPSMSYKRLNDVLWKARSICGIGCRIKVEKLLGLLHDMPKLNSVEDHNAAAQLLNVTMLIGLSKAPFVLRLVQELDPHVVDAVSASHALAPLIISHDPPSSSVLIFLCKVLQDPVKSDKTERAVDVAMSWLREKYPGDFLINGPTATSIEGLLNSISGEKSNRFKPGKPPRFSAEERSHHKARKPWDPQPTDRTVYTRKKIRVWLEEMDRLV